MLRSEIHGFINSIWNKEDKTDQWKELTDVQIHKKYDKAESSNNRGCFLHSSDTGGKTGTQQDSTSAIRRLHDSL
jgi:hypothetical protein